MNEQETQHERAQHVEWLAELRVPFPPEVIGKIPKGRTELDYVGHADITDRLLSVDPFWSWEPVAFNEDGSPLIRTREVMASMWIRLTVCGVTRLGVGTCLTSKDEVEKELIGDALRNAGMRFGLALDLWSKSDRLESQMAVEVRELAATPDPDAADYPKAATADPGPPVLEEQQLGALVRVFDQIGDGAAKIATKQEFVERWGPPAQLAPSSFREALLWATEKAAMWEPPEPAPEDGGMEVGPLPEAYKKADLMRFRPAHLDEEEFMALVLEKARELTPNSKPADVIRSWRGLQGRPALVRSIVGIVEDGLLEEPAPEPFEVES